MTDLLYNASRDELEELQAWCRKLVNDEAISEERLRATFCAFRDYIRINFIGRTYGAVAAPCFDALPLHLHGPMALILFGGSSTEEGDT